MPNTPALVGMGVTGLAALPGVDATGRELASSVLGAVGEIVWFDDEAQLDAVTAISGSGPAYVFYFIEALQEAARRLGMNDEQGRALAVATFTGAAQLAAQSGEPASVVVATCLVTWSQPIVPTTARSSTILPVHRLARFIVQILGVVSA